MILANHGRENRTDPIVPKISQETLADLIGTTRTHVNHFMNKFRQSGFIEYNGDIKVNMSLLNMLPHEKQTIQMPTLSEIDPGMPIARHCGRCHFQSRTIDRLESRGWPRAPRIDTDISLPFGLTGTVKPDFGAALEHLRISLPSRERTGI